MRSQLRKFPAPRETHLLFEAKSPTGCATQFQFILPDGVASSLFRIAFQGRHRSSLPSAIKRRHSNPNQMATVDPTNPLNAIADINERKRPELTIRGLIVG